MMNITAASPLITTFPFSYKGWISPHLHRGSPNIEWMRRGTHAWQGKLHQKLLLTREASSTYHFSEFHLVLQQTKHSWWLWHLSHSSLFFLLFPFFAHWFNFLSKWPGKYHMVVLGLPNFGGLATVCRWQEINCTVAPSCLKWGKSWSHLKMGCYFSFCRIHCRHGGYQNWRGCQQRWRKRRARDRRGDDSWAEG